MSAQAYPAYTVAINSLEAAWAALEQLASAGGDMGAAAEMCAAGVELARQHLHSMDYLLPAA